MTNDNRPKIGVGVWLVYEGKVLFMQRRTEHGEGTWCPQGGHLEHGEHWFECAAREAMEEVGVTIEAPRLFAITNNVFSADKHYVTLHVEAKVSSPDFTNMEPDKHAKIAWFGWDELPEPLFATVATLRAEGHKPSYLSEEN